MKKLFLLFVVVTSLLSCDNNETVNSTNTILPKNVTVEENGVVVESRDYIYVGSKISSIEGYTRNGFFKYEYTYSGNSIVSEKMYLKVNSTDQYSLSNERNYTYYANGKVKTFIESRPGIGLADKSEFVYADEGVILTKSSVNSAGEVFPYSTATLIYSGQNLTEVNESLYNYDTNLYGPGAKAREMLYDNKNSMTKNILGFNELVFNSPVYSLSNNPLEFHGNNTDTYTGDVTNFFGFHYSYDYNNNNYPVIKYSYDANGNLVYTSYITY